MVYPGPGSTKHLHLRAVKGHFVHCTEKKGGHRASSASGELQAAPLPNHSPVPESWLAAVVVVTAAVVTVCAAGLGRWRRQGGMEIQMLK